MSRVLIVASVLALALGAIAPAALAQSDAAQATAPMAGLTEAEFEALAQAFGRRMEGMAGEMQAAINEAAGDAAKQDAALDAVEARYQTDADAFASALETFLNHQASLAGEGAAEAQAQVATALSAALPQIRTLPQQVRARAEQAAVAAAAAPSTPAAPAG